MRELTSLQRVQAVLRGEVPDRLPVVPQCFMFSAKSCGYDIGQINRSPAKMAECHATSLEKYGYDGCAVDVDDATLAEACGAKVIYRDVDVATVDEHNPVLEDLRDIDDLTMPDPYKDGRLPEWLETTKRLLEKVGDHAFVMGRGDQGPFDLLCLLRGTEDLMMDLLTEDEDVILHAMEWATKVHSDFARAQMEIGAHATSMGDAYASPNLISPAMYRKFALPFEKKVVANVADLGVPYSIHICGDTTAIIEDMGSTGAKILEIDWQSDLGIAREKVPNDVVLMGNINPSDPLCTGTPETVRRLVRENIEKTKGVGFIISSGCAMGANTLPENMIAMVESAKEYGTYDQLLELQA